MNRANPTEAYREKETIVKREEILKDILYLLGRMGMDCLKRVLWYCQRIAFSDDAERPAGKK